MVYTYKLFISILQTSLTVSKYFQYFEKYTKKQLQTSNDNEYIYIYISLKNVSKETKQINIF